MKLDNLPDDIIIPISQYCLIDDIFTLRLVSKSTRAVIDTYISAIAPRVAAQTFPHSFLLNRSSKYPTQSLRWLKSLLPTQLAAIALDKDKLRRFPYIHSGFPYGIPYSSSHELALHWRDRVASGWRVLQKLHLVSARVYAAPPPHPATRLSSLGTAVRCNRFRMLVSCPYQACKEHATHRAFSSQYWKGSDVYLDQIRRKEEAVLEERLRLVKGLSNAECEDYLFVWRLLLWAFRPYQRPGGGMDPAEDAGEVLERVANRHKWQAEISNISNGCSWLNWWVLHVGANVFWKQWWKIKNPELVRYSVWRDWMQRTHHQIELEREFVSKLELALRMRCLSVERQKRLEQEEWRGRGVKTISLDCIPWEYDQNPIIHRPPADFPWYRAGSWLWMDGNIWMMVGQRQLLLVQSLESPDQSALSAQDEVDRGGRERRERDPLVEVPYLVYLDIEEAWSDWEAGSRASRFEMIF